LKSNTFFFTIRYLICTYIDNNITAISDVLIRTASLIKEVSGDYVSLSWFWPYQTKKFLVVIRERLKHIQIQTRQIKKWRRKTRFFICIYNIPRNSSLFPIAVLSNASCFGEGDNYIQNLARKLMGKYYFWDYGIYVRIIHCHCFKLPHSSLPIGLLILLPIPLLLVPTQLIRLMARFLCAVCKCCTDFYIRH
jgi:hypothetical protein